MVRLIKRYFGSLFYYSKNNVQRSTVLHFLSRITIPPERTFFYCTLFFVCLGFLVYGNSLDGEFIGDDMVLIVQNSNVQEFSIKSICRLFSLSFFDVTTSMGRIIPPEGGYYRPVCMVSYLLDYAVWKDIPFGYHLTNIILHIASSVLLFLFLQLMRKRTSLSFIVSTVFFIHPIH